MTTFSKITAGKTETAFVEMPFDTLQHRAKC